MAAARGLAFQVRAHRMRMQSADTKSKLMDCDKRKLRLKVAHIINEVKRRQDLQLQQAKARKFREQRHSAGRGPLPSLGDATELGLGLLGLANDSQSEVAPSPRRVCILEALSLEELDMMRRDPWYFLEGHPSQGPDPHEPAESDVSTLAADGTASIQGVIDFFTPAREEKDLPIGTFAKLLRAHLTSSGQKNEKQAEGVDAAWIRWRTASMAAAASTVPCAASERVHEDPAHAWRATERMPCLGRRPAARTDCESPTLTKVREVYNRRDAVDVKRAEERLEAMDQRLARNAFKVMQQQREAQSELVKAKELHQVRMLETEERKAALEAEDKERIAKLEAARMRQTLSASRKAEEMLESKRDRVCESLEAWYTGVQRGERRMREKERKAIHASEEYYQKYMTRLHNMGETWHGPAETHVQMNEKMERRIQSSLSDQLKDQRRLDCIALAEAIDAKLDAAALRRQLQHARYNLLDRAFGTQAPQAGVRLAAVASEPSFVSE